MLAMNGSPDRSTSVSVGFSAWSSEPELYQKMSVISPVASRVLTRLSPSPPGTRLDLDRDVGVAAPCRRRPAPVPGGRVLRVVDEVGQRDGLVPAPCPAGQRAHEHCRERSDHQATPGAFRVPWAPPTLRWGRRIAVPPRRAALVRRRCRASSAPDQPSTRQVLPLSDLDLLALRLRAPGIPCRSASSTRARCASRGRWGQGRMWPGRARLRRPGGTAVPERDACQGGSRGRRHTPRSWGWQP